jgi:hypothetical protein
MIDWGRTLLSQYYTSPTLTQLIANFNTNIDPTANLQSMFDLIWNVLDLSVPVTSYTYGLDVWERIVGVGRVLNVATGVFFGFAEPGDITEAPFNQAPFYSGQPATGNFALSNEAYRQLIIAKAAANICDGSIQAINFILMRLFSGRGNCYVRDNGNMSMTYVFEFVLQPFEVSIVSNSGVLPKPAGVFTNMTSL